MFRSPVVADPPTPHDVVPSEASVDTPGYQLVPLSVLELDLPAPGEGWAAYLADRDISIAIDDIGRASVARSDARRLFDEKREREARAREHAAVVERQAIEADQRWRAQLPGGVPWYKIPDDVLPVVAMTQAERDAQPRRQSMLEEALSNSETLTFHPLSPTEELGHGAP